MSTKIAKLYMEESEIVSMYRDAKDKSKQVTILSELNACSVDEIIEVLKCHGITGKQLPRKSKKSIQESEKTQEDSQPLEIIPDDEVTVIDVDVQPWAKSGKEPVSICKTISVYDILNYIHDLKARRNKLQLEIDAIDAQLNQIGQNCIVSTSTTVTSNGEDLL